jgi:UDP-3-O-[3-hydroxymyristoyl] glucosamine N-acyltransferase
LEVVDHVHVSAATVVTRSIKRPGHYSGVFPFDDNAAWEKNAATLRQLHRLRERLRALERGFSAESVAPAASPSAP